MTRLSLLKVFTRTSALVLALVFLSIQTASALTESDRTQLYKPFYDPGSELFCDTNGGPDDTAWVPGSVYVLGDSLTAGMRDSGGLGDKLVAAGWSPTVINAVGGKDLRWGREQLAADPGTVAASDSILIGLGTNNVGDVVRDGGVGTAAILDNAVENTKRLMQDVVDAAKSANPDIKIYWTSVYTTGTLSTVYGTFDLDTAMAVLNGALGEVAQSNGINILPWGTSSEARDLTSSDGIHPSGKYPEMASYIVEQLGAVASGRGVTAVGCVCGSLGSISRDERYRNTWAYLTTQKGLSEEAAAGLMGNLEAESGIDPHNTQNDAPAPDGPEIPIDAIRGSFGYGIAQWTSAGRQENLIAYAQETGRSTGDLGLQLDFLWKELSESYTGVLTVLQTPEVSVDESSDEVLLRFEIPRSVLPESGEASRQQTINERRALGQKIYAEFAGQNISATVGGGCSISGIALDLISEDTSNILCPDGITDRGPADGYRDGKPIKIRLCLVGGALINSQLAGSVAKMLEDSAAAGADLSINGSFRSMDGQISIYNSWCDRGGITPTPPPYPKANWEDYVRCPGAAPPGYSNHQAGFALDLECNDVLIPQSYAAASTNRCFQWLVENAATYGLYEFGKGESRGTSGYEGWHWSVDGS